MTQKALLQSAGDGTVVPAGYVVERIAFTRRTVTAITAGFTANSNAVVTLTPGVWLLFGELDIAQGVGVTGCISVLSTNSNNDGTGGLGNGTEVYDANFGGWYAMIVYYYLATSNTPIYFKAKNYGASSTAGCEGFALRIA